jgi:hypothetical protein
MAKKKVVKAKVRQLKPYVKLTPGLGDWQEGVKDLRMERQSVASLEQESSNRTIVDLQNTVVDLKAQVVTLKGKIAIFEAAAHKATSWEHFLAIFRGS